MSEAAEKDAPQSGDAFIRTMLSEQAVPEFPDPALVLGPELATATVAIVTSAALHQASDDRFTSGDTSYRMIDREARDLVLGHWSPNFDRSGFAADINVVFPIDRLAEMAADGTIGAVAPRHVSFAGNQPDDVATLRMDSGPAAAKALKDDGVDVVVLTPV